MNLKQQLKGIYTYSFTISTMFGQYTFRTNKHNLITTEGMNFIFSKLLFINNEESYNINSTEIIDEFINGIILGTTKRLQASVSDTYSQVVKEYELFVSPYIDENNSIVFSTNSSEQDVTGDMLNGITEIGLITSKQELNQNTTKLSSDDTTLLNNSFIPKLITHDIHEPFQDLPSSAKLTVEYKLLFDIGNYLVGFTKVDDYEHLYEYVFDKEIIGLKNLDNFYNYSVYPNTLEEMDSTDDGKGKYKQLIVGDTTKLYLRTEDDYSPNGKNIVVYNSIYDFTEE